MKFKKVKDYTNKQNIMFIIIKTAQFPQVLIKDSLDTARFMGYIHNIRYIYKG